MSSPGDPSASIPAAAAPRSSRGHFWLRELPYAAILILTIFGIAYTSYQNRFFDPTPDTMTLGDDPSNFHGDRIKFALRDDVAGELGPRLLPGNQLR